MCVFIHVLSIPQTMPHPSLCNILSPADDEDIEIESKASEVGNMDVPILVTKEDDISEEGDILVAADEERNMKEFLQSEEGTKWLLENPDKKVTSDRSSHWAA